MRLGPKPGFQLGNFFLKQEILVNPAAWKGPCLLQEEDSLLLMPFNACAHKRAWKPCVTSLECGGKLWAGLCILAWAYVCCSAHPASADTTPAQETHLPKVANAEVVESTWSYGAHAMPWGCSSRHWLGHEGNQLWGKIACHFAWNGVLIGNGGEWQRNGGGMASLQISRKISFKLSGGFWNRKSTELLQGRIFGNAWVQLGKTK